MRCYFYGVTSTQRPNANVCRKPNTKGTSPRDDTGYGIQIGFNKHSSSIKAEALAKVVKDAVKQLGQLDFVIHSIAWAPLDDLHAHVIDTTSEGFSRAMEVSCHSFASLAKVCVNHMPEGGSLITMTYLGAQRAIPHYGLMGPVKAALESLVRYMAIELGSQAIRVHAVSPGPIMTRAASGIESFDELLEHSKSVAPLKRLVTLEEIANLAVFLSSDASSGMTGQTIYVDAGCHAVA